MYDDYCPKCNGDERTLQLALKEEETLFKRLKKAVKDAYAVLFSAESYKPIDLEKYTKLINATNAVFKQALKKGVADNVIPTVMRTALEKDIFVFSGLKTHAQLFEASRQLLTEDGKIKSFNQFSLDVAKIQEDYNQTYLEAEYQFAVSSSQNAAKWTEIEKNKVRYDLQYRTAKDERVRETHQVLDGITLPASDAFWKEYYPPNGWRCRCRAIEVLKDKYPLSDSKEAVKKGANATSNIGKDGENRLEIFRFNPGMEKVIFPKNHPYNKVAGANEVKKEINDLNKK